jgi:hypothetical protein
MTENDNMIMPPSGELVINFTGHKICSVPLSILVMLAGQHGASDQNEYFNALSIAPDDVINREPHVTPEDCINFLQKSIHWDSISKCISCPLYMMPSIENLWNSQSLELNNFSLELKSISMPDTIYRYMQYHHERILELITGGKLFLPCPAMFNDPFDCSLDEPTKLTFIESAIGCFSTKPNDVLMFLHYADNHRGLCVGFDTRKLVSSLNLKNSPLRADIRPVSYFPSMPKLNHKTRPALSATCKSDIWNYENEFRLFMAKGSSLVGYGTFYFDKEAISEIIIGCKAYDDTIASCKLLTNDLAFCTQRVATQKPNCFGVQLHEIHKT